MRKNFIDPNMEEHNNDINPVNLSAIIDASDSGNPVEDNSHDGETTQKSGVFGIFKECLRQEDWEFLYSIIEDLAHGRRR